MLLKKCLKCGALVEVLKDCKCKNCGITCCGETMSVIKSNSTDGAVEKHKPEYEVIGNKVIITVNHVMEEEHYIAWIRVESEHGSQTFTFKPGDKPRVEVPYIENMTIYSYCNKHGLWENIVK